MSNMMGNIRAKVKRRFSHKDPEPNLDDDYSSADEDTKQYINKEVEDHEKEGDKYPLGRPNSYLNRLISHGNQKTERQLAQEAAAYEAQEKAHRQATAGQQNPGGPVTGSAPVHDQTTYGQSTGGQGQSYGGQGQSYGDQGQNYGGQSATGPALADRTGNQYSTNEGQRY